MKLTRLIDWPGDRTNPGNDYRPWWRIAWITIWLVPLMLLFAVSLVLVFIAFGPKTADGLLDELLE